VKRKSLDLDVLHVPAYVEVTKVRRPGRGHSTIFGVPSVPIKHPGSVNQFDLTLYIYIQFQLLFPLCTHTISSRDHNQNNHRKIYNSLTDVTFIYKSFYCDICSVLY
jgi:hypothetical protein